MRLLECPQRRAISDIDARKFEGPAAIIATPGVELCAVVRKRKQVSPENTLEAVLRGLHVRTGIGRPPP